MYFEVDLEPIIPKIFIFVSPLPPLNVELLIHHCMERILEIQFLPIIRKLGTILFPDIVVFRIKLLF